MSGAPPSINHMETRYCEQALNSIEPETLAFKFEDDPTLSLQTNKKVQKMGVRVPRPKFKAQSKFRSLKAPT